MDSSDDEKRTPRRAASTCWGIPTTSPSGTPTRRTATTRGRVGVLCSLHRVLNTVHRRPLLDPLGVLQLPLDTENNEDMNGE